MELNTADKYYWIIDHKGIGVPDAQASIEITPNMVNPVTKHIEEDSSLNTELNWWVELSCLDELKDEYKTHYHMLDTGGITVDDAIDNLYTLVKQHYGESK